MKRSAGKLQLRILLLLATDLADYLVETGVRPFRSAHHFIGELVALSEKQKYSLSGFGSSGDAIEICPALGENWRDVFDLIPCFRECEKDRECLVRLKSN